MLKRTDILWKVDSTEEIRFKIKRLYVNPYKRIYFKNFFKIDNLRQIYNNFYGTFKLERCKYIKQ